MLGFFPHSVKMFATLKLLRFTVETTSISPILISSSLYNNM